MGAFPARQVLAAVIQNHLDVFGPAVATLKLVDQRPDVVGVSGGPAEVPVQLERQNLGRGNGVQLAIWHGWPPLSQFRNSPTYITIM